MKQRREYLAGWMKVELLRGVAVDEIEEVYRVQDPNDRLPLFRDRRCPDLRPSSTQVLRSTLHVREWRCQRLKPDDSDTYYLVVTHLCAPWAGSLTDPYDHQRYAICLEMVDEGRLDLYNLVRQQVGRAAAADVRRDSDGRGALSVPGAPRGRGLLGLLAAAVRNEDAVLGPLRRTRLGSARTWRSAGHRVSSHIRRRPPPARGASRESSRNRPVRRAAGRRPEAETGPAVRRREGPGRDREPGAVRPRDMLASMPWRKRPSGSSVACCCTPRLLRRARAASGA